MTGSGLDRRRFLRKLGGACIGLASGVMGAEAIGGRPAAAAIQRRAPDAPALRAAGWNAIAGSASGGPPGAVLPRDVLPEVARVWRAMGTLVEVRVQGLPESDAVESIRRVRRRLAEVESSLTIHRPGSVLSRLSGTAEGSWLDADLELVRALEQAGRAVASSDGAFDPTVAPMMRAWGLHDLDPREPSEKLRRVWLSRPGWDALELDLPNRRLRRLDRRIEVDLGGIGKGIGLDAALVALSKSGATHALVNLGGSIGVTGGPCAADGGGAVQGWPIGIAHPRRPGAIWSVVRLRSGHLATSGDSERFVDGPGGRRHHLLDPRTGDSVRGVAAATVWAPTGVEADVASTVAFVEAGRRDDPGPLVRSLPRLLLREDGGIVEQSAGAWSERLGA